MCPLSFQKIHVTPMEEFSTLIEARGDVCLGTSNLVLDFFFCIESVKPFVTTLVIVLPSIFVVVADVN